MYFKKLSLHNFGPYYGTHEVPLEVTEDHPVIVFHGENMRGKTSLFNSLRWVLYGKALSRQRESLQPADLFNTVAQEEGSPEAWVELNFEDDGANYVVNRRILRDGSGRFDTRFRVQAGATVLSADAAEITIARLMDESISRFFLFDGEMLGEYERLLSDTSTESGTVRESIESILGLPALRLLADDLRTLAAEAYDRQAKKSTAEKKADQAAAEHAQKTVLLGETENSLRQAERRLVRLNRERTESEAELSALHDAKVSLEKIRQIEFRRDAAAAEVEEIKQRIQVLLRERWWFPVGPLIDGQLEVVRERLRGATARDARVNALREAERNLKESLSNTHCDTCSQPLPEAQMAAIRAKLVEVEVEIEKATAPMTPSVQDLLGLEDQLRPFATPADAGRLREFELRIRKLRQEIRIANQDVAELEGQLRGHEEAEVRAKQIKYEEAVKGIQRLEAELRGLRKQKGELQAELATLQRRAASAVTRDNVAALEQAAFQTLSDLFDSAIVRFREALRQEVEAEASRIFRLLTTERDYQGLRINEQYGLRILDETGGVLRVRSAGAEQVVALSLIGALNACAVRQGPLVMDTPFGRLDEGHRTNILDWAPGVSRQVLLLVQSGEIDPKGDLLPKIRPLTQREYRIVRDGSPRKSKLEALSG